MGAFQSGTVSNIIPDTARLEISIRSTDPALRETLRLRVEAICRSHAEGLGCKAEFQWLTGYPASVNDEEAVEEAAAAVRSLFGEDAIGELANPIMGSEDFSFLLEKVPGAYVLIGNGDSTGCHTATYDFNDALLEPGSGFFHRIVRRHCD